MRLGRMWVGWAILGLVACGGDDDGGDDGGAVDSGTMGVGATESSGGSGNDLPTVEIEIDASATCGADGSLLLRATQVGCVSPPPAPCTMPMTPPVYEGDTIACPSTEAAATMRVGIEKAGRYNVELVTVAGDGTESTECFSDRDDPELIVDDSAFNTNRTIPAMSLGGPC